MYYKEAGNNIIEKNVSKFYYSKGVIASEFSKINLKLKRGEFVAITTLASVPEILLCAYIIKLLSNVNYIDEYITINLLILILSIIIIYISNLIVGLIPVFNTIRKRPAEILSKIDIQ